MRCASFDDDLWMLLEPDDGSTHRRALESHAAYCSECAHAERSYRATVRLVRLAFRDAGAGKSEQEEGEELVAAILSARLRQLPPASSRPN